MTTPPPAKKMHAATIELAADGAKCVIQLFGATVTHFSVTTSQHNLLFVSSQAVFDGVKPIRGGIPLVFPMFGAGDGTLPSHGFARISTWTVLGQPSSNYCVLGLDSNSAPAAAAAWPYKFALEYHVTLKPTSLTTRLVVRNVDDKPWAFQALLHTYYSVPDCTKIRIAGLHECTFVDQVSKGAVGLQGKEDIKIDKEVDWIVSGVPVGREVQLKYQEDGGGVRLRREFEVAGQPVESDVVVWNPWIDKSKKMADFGDEEYHNMVCIEPGNVATKPGAVLGPGQEAFLMQELIPHL
jgi:D-hexose-6-phosphate mutarotase